MRASDITINNTLDISQEEIVEFKQFVWNEKKLFVRNFATTSSLLNTTWAQTPHELVNEIRYQATLPIKEGLSWQLTSDNGSHLEGKIASPFNTNHPWFTDYTVRREEVGYYRPWPEWVIPPVRLANTNGIFIFDRMLSWWSRYIGISPYFNKQIRLKIENSRITMIEGGDEAEALKRFLNSMHSRLGDGVYDFNALHFGVHPHASVPFYRCPNIIYHRIIDHSHTSNIHVHVGAPAPTNDYPYWVHITGDIRNATFKVGDALIHDRGYLTALAHPSVRAVAAKYPGRLGPEPGSPIDLP